MTGKLFRKYRIHLFISLIAVIIWLHVKTEMTYEDVALARIVPVNQNPEFVIVNDYTKFVPIKFQGKGKSLLALKNTNVDILADLNQTDWAEYVAKLEFRDIRISPPLVNINAIEFLEKDTIHFRLEPLRYKKVPIVPALTIKPKPGFIQVGAVQVEPGLINISGPLNYIRKTKIIYTDSLLLKDLTAPARGTVSLRNPFPGKLRLGDEVVQYFIDIQQIGEKIVEDIPIEVSNAPKQKTVAVTPSTLTLKLVGGVNVLSKVRREDVRAFIDYRKFLQTGDSDSSIFIRLPENVSYSEIYPQRFQIKVY